MGLMLEKLEVVAQMFRENPRFDLAYEDYFAAATGQTAVS